MKPSSRIFLSRSLGLVLVGWVSVGWTQPFHLLLAEKTESGVGASRQVLTAAHLTDMAPPPRTDLVISQLFTPNPAPLGSNFLQSILITNRGPVSAFGVSVTNRLAPGLEFLEATSSQGTCTLNGPLLTCELGTMAAQTSATIDVLLRSSGLGTRTNRVNVRADAPDLEPIDNMAVNSVRVIQPGPLILEQPQSSTVGIGDQVILSVSAQGALPLTYQWRKNGVNLAGQTNAELIFAQAHSTNSGFYSVRIGNVAASILSIAAHLSVLAPPLINFQPRDAQAAVGKTIVFTVLAGGSPPLTYQWFHAANSITGATEPTLLIAAASMSDAGQYHVEVMNPVGTNKSALVSLDVLTAPAITAQPVTTQAALGANAMFSVSATGSSPLDYQWKHNGLDLPGATDSTLTVTDVKIMDGGNYSVWVSNPVGATSSMPAELIVEVPPRALADNFEDRVTLTASSGSVSGTNLSATFQNNEPLHAGQVGGKSVWYDWTPSADGIATFITIGSSFDTLLAVYTGTDLEHLTVIGQDDDEGQFYSSRVRFRASQGTHYAIALDGFFGDGGRFLLTWELESTEDALPGILTQPQRQTVLPGSEVTFTVTAIGNGLTYQWLYNGHPIAGATTNILRITNAGEDDVGRYRVMVLNDDGRPFWSDFVTLELGPIPTVHSEDKVRRSSQLLMGGGGSGDSARVRLASSSGGGASLIAGVTYSFRLNTTDYGADNSDSNCCGTKPTVSIATTETFKAPSDGYMLFDISASSSSGTLYVYAGGFENCSCTQEGRLLINAISNMEYLPVADLISTNTNFVLSVAFDQCPTNSYAPRDLSILEGNTTNLATLVINSASPLTYQWYHNGSPMAGETDSFLSLANVDAAHAGNYEVMVANVVCSQLMPVANVTIDMAARVTADYLKDQTPRLEIVGFDDQSFVLQRSSDLINWMSVESELSENGELRYTEYLDAIDLIFFRAKAVSVNAD